MFTRGLSNLRISAQVRRFSSDANTLQKAMLRSVKPNNVEEKQAPIPPKVEPVKPAVEVESKPNPMMNPSMLDPSMKGYLREFAPKISVILNF